jgi:hypothetical protein
MRRLRTPLGDRFENQRSYRLRIFVHVQRIEIWGLSDVNPQNKKKGEFLPLPPTHLKRSEDNPFFIGTRHFGSILNGLDKL